ncbi:ABC transporter ATP-binding protein [Curtobacterium ammoniigenes]|uniref:ABC transporter ATP-binding protein n=1 Tax=Curtobacterium ammoniigenes TaxID=395387 RepID=UPI001C3F2D5E|nr:ATP-binding cassette domain-containing protein [Curtobacterium ammoniigenes]
MLSDVSFDLRSGESTAIVGPSGSGKSTLLGILGLLDEPTSGDYAVNGLHTAGLRDRERTRLRRERIAFVFQAFHLVPHLTAVENVAEPLRISGRSWQDRRERAAAELSRVGLPHRAWARPNVLSGGEQQRVAVARALVAAPDLLLCDEPTGNLDSRNASRVLDLILGARTRGCAVVVVTHDPSVAERCGAELVVTDGRVERRR